MTGEVFWAGKPAEDDFGVAIQEVFYDARTTLGPWAIMAPSSWEQYRVSEKLGTGIGQKYRKQDDGRFLKVDG